jgi:hypothetical protein
MRREYDIFEKFHDGSTIWRATIAGRFEAERRMNELAERSQNDFFLIDVKAGKHLPFNLTGSRPRPSVKSTVA